MELRYEITIDEYAAGQSLYLKLSKGRKVIVNALTWIMIGLLFFVFARSEPVFGWSAFALSCVGILLIYWGFLNIFPYRYFRRAYRKSALAGKSYHAELDAQGFRVTGDDCGWQALWQGVSVKGEDKLVFIFYAANTIFIFGKKYLPLEKQDELRRIAGLVSPLSDGLMARKD